MSNPEVGDSWVGAPMAGTAKGACLIKTPKVKQGRAKMPSRWEAGGVRSGFFLPLLCPHLLMANPAPIVLSSTKGKPSRGQPTERLPHSVIGAQGFLEARLWPHQVRARWQREVWIEPRLEEGARGSEAGEFRQTSHHPRLPHGATGASAEGAGTLP